MRAELRHNCIFLVAENELEMWYLEDALKLKTEEDFLIARKLSEGTVVVHSKEMDDMRNEKA
jgi:hypothetical protein